MTDEDLTVQILGETVRVSARVDELIIRPLRLVLLQTVGYLSAPACARFLAIYAEEVAGRPYVVPADFRRHSDEHREYRELRHSLLIRPRAGGRWDPGKEVEVCPFSHLMYQQHRDDLIDKAASLATPTDSILVEGHSRDRGDASA